MSQSGDQRMFIDTMQLHVDFDRARARGRRRQLISRLSRRSNELLPFNEICQQQSFKGQRDLGTQIVPINQIIGSLTRCSDFDRAFYPRHTETCRRWLSIAKAFYEGVTLPPIELYKIGEMYFVKDGHHRVSVARSFGQGYLDATVIEIDLQ